MATWGTKTFEDDTAIDWLAELIQTEETIEFLHAAIALSEDDELDYDTGVAALAAAEVIVAILDEPRKGLPEELLDWVGDNQCDDIADFPEVAKEALTLVLSKQSELENTWADAEDYDEWRAEVDELLEIITQLADA